MNIKKVVFAILTTLTILFSTACVAQAYNNSFSYEGTGVQDLYSKNTAYITANKSIAVTHTQKRDYPTNYSTTVRIAKKEYGEHPL